MADFIGKVFLVAGLSLGTLALIFFLVSYLDRRAAKRNGQGDP